MAVSKYKTWIPNEILTAADLNASFDQVFNNQGSFGYPRDGISDFNGFELILDADGDTSISTEVDDRIDFKLAGQDLVIFDGTVASPVNGLTLVAGATGNAPQILAHGLDTNIGITLTPKGTGAVTISGPLTVTGATTVTGGTDLDGNPLTIDADGDSTLRATADDVVALRLQDVDVFIFDGDVAGSAHGITFTAAAAGGDVTGAASGAGADINLALTAKGAGTLKLAGTAVTINGGPVTATPTANAVVVANASGNLANGWLSPANIDQHSDFVLLAVASPTAVASVDFSSTVIDNATYSEFFFQLKLTFSVDDTEIAMRTDVSNGVSVDAAASDYSYALAMWNSSAGESVGDPATSMMTMCDTGAGNGVGNAANEGLQGHVYFRCGDASTLPSAHWQHVYVDASTRSSVVIGAGHRRAVGPVNFVRFLSTTGTISGTIRCYGMKAA